MFAACGCYYSQILYDAQRLKLVAGSAVGGDAANQFRATVQTGFRSSQERYTYLYFMYGIAFCWLQQRPKRVAVIIVYNKHTVVTEERMYEYFLTELKL